MDDSEIIEEDDELITDHQFSGSENPSNDLTTNNKQYRFIRRQHNLIYDAMHGDDNDDDVDCEDDDDDSAIDTKHVNTITYIETTDADGEDGLNLEQIEQICVPVDGDNVSWIGLSS